MVVVQVVEIGGAVAIDSAEVLLCLEYFECNMYYGVLGRAP